MKKSKNYTLGKNKFFNIQKGKKKNHFFFFLPTIMASPKKLLHWDLIMFSIFLGWGNFFIQFNIFEVVKDTNTEVYKENMSTLMVFLKNNGLGINDMQAALEFLNKNNYIVQLIKNANLDHPYIKSIFLQTFQGLPFIRSLTGMQKN